MTFRYSLRLNHTMKKIPKWIEDLSKLLDSSIKIPGTNITIGLDPIISLIPGLGDVASYAASVVLLIGIVNEGVSGKLVLKMLGNILLDLIIGLIPGVGSVFDFFFKANDRNLQLLREYNDEGKHKGSGGWIILLLVGATILLILLGISAFVWSMRIVSSWIGGD